MKDFAKSIVCNTKVGNIAADITTDGNTWFVTTSDGKKKEFTSEREAEEYVKKIKTGNSNVGNATIKFYGEIIDLTKKSESDLKEILEELQALHEGSDEQRAIKEELKRRKVGNTLKYTSLEEAKKMCKQMNDSLAPDAALRHYRHVYEKDGEYYVMETGEAVSKGMKRAQNSKVGNADKYSGNYIIMSDDGDVWFRYEHEDVSIKNIDSWAQKRIAEYQRSINEIQKGVQEAKQAAKKFGLL